MEKHNGGNGVTDAQDRGWEFAILKRCGQEGPNEERFQQDTEQGEIDPWGHLREESSRKWEQPMQRPWGKTRPGVQEEQQGGPCGWSRVGRKKGGRAS